MSFDLSSLVHYALRREVMAWRTYERLADLAPGGAAQSMMLQLMGFEEEHVRQFTEVLRPQLEAAGLDPDDIVSTAEDEPLDMGGYVDESLLSQASLPEIMRAAFRFEEAMARYYAEQAALSEDETVRAVLERLSAEEASHQRFIDDLLASLAINPEDDPEEFPNL